MDLELCVVLMSDRLVLCFLQLGGKVAVGLDTGVMCELYEFRRAVGGVVKGLAVAVNIGDALCCVAGVLN